MTLVSLAAAMDGLTVTAGGARFCIPVSAIGRIEAIRAVTRVPGQPLWVRGVLQADGQVVLVIDLGLVVGDARAPVCSRTHIVFLRGEGRGLGLAVDALGEVVKLRCEDAFVCGAHASPARAALTLAWHNGDQGLLEVLDPRALFEFGTPPRAHAAAIDSSCCDKVAAGATS